MAKKKHEYICEACLKVISEDEYMLNYRQCTECMVHGDVSPFEEDGMAHALSFGQEEWNDWGNDEA